VPYATITADLDESLDVGLHLSPEVALHLALLIKDVSNLTHLFVTEFLDS